MTARSPSASRDTLRPSANDWLTAPNGSLILLNAHSDKSGRYLCHVTNGIGQDLNQVVNFTVKAPPTILTGGDGGGDVGFVSTSVGVDSTKLECEANGDRPISVTWTKVSLDPMLQKIHPFWPMNSQVAF